MQLHKTHTDRFAHRLNRPGIQFRLVLSWNRFPTNGNEVGPGGYLALSLFFW